MSTVGTRANVKEQRILVKVIRADGRVEDLGCVSYYHRNPIRRWAFAARQFLRKVLK